MAHKTPVLPVRSRASNDRYRAEHDRIFGGAKKMPLCGDCGKRAAAHAVHSTEMGKLEYIYLCKVCIRKYVITTTVRPVGEVLDELAAVDNMDYVEE